MQYYSHGLAEEWINDLSIFAGGPGIIKKNVKSTSVKSNVKNW